jgi:hypothetical protein
MLIKYALFWDITQRLMVILYRRFGTNIGPIFKGQYVPLLGPWRWDRYVIPKGLPLDAAFAPEERRSQEMRLFENMVLRKTFGPKRKEVAGGWNKINEALR